MDQKGIGAAAAAVVQSSPGAVWAGGLATLVYYYFGSDPLPWGTVIAAWTVVLTPLAEPLRALLDRVTSAIKGPQT